MDFRIFVEPQVGASFDTQLAVAQAAERLGFDGFFRSEHYLDFGPTPALPGPTDSWVTLAGIALRTERVRLGTLVSSVTFRYPGPLAVAVAQVDAMSGGRVELGLGAGWFDREHAAYAVPFPPLAARMGMLEETARIVTGLWDTAPGQRFSFSGRHYRVTDSPGLPKPVQRPHPPLILGGLGARRTPELAARYASEFNVPFASPGDTAAAFDRVRERAAALGRPDPVLSFAITVCCGLDGAQRRRRAAAIGADLADLEKRAAAGSPAQVVDRLAEYAQAGATRAYLQLIDMTDLDHVALLAEQVAPQLR